MWKALCLLCLTACGSVSLSGSDNQGPNDGSFPQERASVPAGSEAGPEVSTGDTATAVDAGTTPDTTQSVPDAVLSVDADSVEVNQPPLLPKHFPITDPGECFVPNPCFPETTMGPVCPPNHGATITISYCMGELKHTRANYIALCILNEPKYYMSLLTQMQTGQPLPFKVGGGRIYECSPFDNVTCIMECPDTPRP